MHAHDRFLPEWFNRIRSRQVTLPRFQRHVAWGHGEVSGLLTTVLRGLPSGAALVLQVGDEEKLSNAVDPSSTASVTTTPGRTGSDGRWSSGLPTTILPEAGFRRNGERRDTAMLYTPNGSARANQRWPQSPAPPSSTTA